MVKHRKPKSKSTKSSSTGNVIIRAAEAWRKLSESEKKKKKYQTFVKNFAKHC